MIKGRKGAQVIGLRMIKGIITQYGRKKSVHFRKEIMWLKRKE